jgi:hypothetical protein
MSKQKPQSEEYRRFETLLGDVLSVSKTELSCLLSGRFECSR